jgi:DNA-directed RNA polymerase specialized sigma24 family protein
MESAELTFLADPTVRAAALRRALRFMQTRADAEDAVQEATVRALRYRGSLRCGSLGTPWFYRWDIPRQ